MKNILDLTGKTAIIGGATQGIGKAIAFQLAEMNAECILIARNKEKLESVVKELKSKTGNTHHYLVADYSEPEQLHTALNEKMSKNQKVHIVVNNTGGPPAGLAVDGKIEDYMAAFKQHLICNQILTKFSVPKMKKEGFGRIINILSTSVKQPIPNLGVSNTVRGAVAQWARTLAKELGEFGITINNILPGLVRTARLDSIIANRAGKRGMKQEDVEREMKNLVPVKRFARPEEIGYLAGFLCASTGDYINGASIPVDGGRLS